ncbi:MAG: hypothetical protein F6J89_31555 [Symploca sp. SIO1C4]|uniref:Uncharacterized protein n=1 Tax=Symploca sp. SIO1C4 TaxID=2607765 RepID=A0A6B3NR97_9CYAN|nr:hypothetical protein [Symploca sp. SIO1C4]
MTAQINHDLLILPGNPWFEITLATLLPDWQQAAAIDGNTYAFVASAEDGLLRAVTSNELEDYLNGGEYEERLKQMNDVETICGDLH